MHQAISSAIGAGWETFDFSRGKESANYNSIPRGGEGVKMREPHRSIEAGTVRLTPYLFAVNQLEAAQPPALTYPMLQAATMICQEYA